MILHLKSLAVAVIGLFMIVASSRAWAQVPAPDRTLRPDARGVLRDASGRDVGFWGIDTPTVNQFPGAGDVRYFRPPHYSGPSLRTLLWLPHHVTRVAVIADKPDEAPAEFVSRAIDPETGPFRETSVDTLAPADLTDDNAGDYALFLLVDVARPTAEMADLLHRRVQQGAGLCIMLGPRAEMRAYRRNFFRMGRELLPVVPGRVVDVKEDEGKVHPIQFAQHSLSHGFRGAGGRELLASVVVRKHHAAEFDDDNGAEKKAERDVQVVARVNDTPLILERRSGKGRILAILTSPDEKWTNWMLQPSWVVFLHRVRRHLTASPADDAQHR